MAIREWRETFHDFQEVFSKWRNNSPCVTKGPDVDGSGSGSGPDIDFGFVWKAKDGYNEKTDYE